MLQLQKQNITIGIGILLFTFKCKQIFAHCNCENNITIMGFRRKHYWKTTNYMYDYILL